MYDIFDPIMPQRVKYGKKKSKYSCSSLKQVINMLDLLNAAIQLTRECKTVSLECGWPKPMLDLMCKSINFLAIICKQSLTKKKPLDRLITGRAAKLLYIYHYPASGQGARVSACAGLTNLKSIAFL